jgi:hypothetical protein
MNEKGGFPDFKNIEKGLMDHIGKDPVTRDKRKKYRAGIAICVTVMLLITVAFVYILIVMPSEPGTSYWIELGIVSVLLVASIVASNVILGRLQSRYFADASGSGEEYVKGLVNNLKGGKN